MLKRKIFLIQVILFLLIISTREQLSVDEQTQVNKYHTCLYGDPDHNYLCTLFLAKYNYYWNCRSS